MWYGLRLPTQDLRSAFLEQVTLQTALQSNDVKRHVSAAGWTGEEYAIYHKAYPSYLELKNRNLK